MPAPCSFPGWRPSAKLAQRLVLVLVLAAFATSLSVTQARADFGFSSFSFDAQDQSNQPSTQAAGHPDEVTVDFALNTDAENAPDENLKDISVNLPPGFIGDPGATPRCEIAELTSAECPGASQVGTLDLTRTGGAQLPTLPVYNIVPPDGIAAQFGFDVTGTNQLISSNVRPDGGYALMSDLSNISAVIPIIAARLNLWGVPADPIHDSERVCAGDISPCSSGGQVKPLFRNPTSCNGRVQAVNAKADSWQHPGVFDTTSDSLPAVTGCENLAFDPNVTTAPTTTRASSPSGMDFNIAVDDPGLTDPDAIAASDLKKAVVTLPEGMSVNPSSADGLGACSPQQVAQETFDSDFGAGCPANSKIGSVEIESPLLEEHLEGSIFLATQNNNPFNELLAGYLVAKSPERGISVALPGKIETDPVTGRVTATFDNNPQLPFSDLDVHFKTGPRAPLITPETCGTYEVKTELFPWSGGASVIETDQFAINSAPDGGPCLAGDPSLPGNPADKANLPFDLEFSGGLKDPLAAGSSPFVMRLTRPDGHQQFDQLAVSTPPGLSAYLRGIPLCSDADAAAGTCSEESRVGTSTTGAGAGPNPFFIDSGEVFLAGPYKSSPLSLAIEVPAKAGPFDLGTVLVRAQIQVDPRTAQITVVTDPLPRILEGIPLHIRDIRVNMNRPGFMLAPTNCDPLAVAAVVTGSHGATAFESVPFQVSGCGELGFGPELSFAATGGKNAIKKNKHLGLDATLEYPEPGAQSNISSVQVSLPPGMLLDQDSPALVAPCTRPQYAANECPASSQIGTATARTPLFDEPLSGPVYLKTSDNLLPDIAADLSGIVDIDLFGRVDQDGTPQQINQGKGRIQNTFDIVPDAPVSDFKLSISPESELLVNTNSKQGLCTPGRRTIDIAMSAHNNDGFSEETQIAAKCPKKKPGKDKCKDKKAKPGKGKCCKGKGNKNDKAALAKGKGKCKPKGRR